MNRLSLGNPRKIRGLFQRSLDEEVEGRIGPVMYDLCVRGDTEIWTWQRKRIVGQMVKSFFKPGPSYRQKKWGTLSNRSAKNNR